MTILDDFGAELVHDLTWEKFASRDQYGAPTYLAPQVLKARTDFTRRNRINARGQLFESTGESYFYAPTARIEDRFMIHTGDVVQNIDVSVIDDVAGAPYATRLIFG